MSTIEALKSTWPSAYLLLLLHLAIATFLFRRSVSRSLVKSGLSSNAHRAAWQATLAYIYSSCLVLALSYPTSALIFGTNDAIDIRLLPMYYQWLGRIALTPVSVLANYFFVRRLLGGVDRARSTEVLGIVASPEKLLFLVNLLFAVFYV